MTREAGERAPTHPRGFAFTVRRELRRILSNRFHLVFLIGLPCFGFAIILLIFHRELVRELPVAVCDMIVGIRSGRRSLVCGPLHGDQIEKFLGRRVAEGCLVLEDDELTRAHLAPSGRMVVIEHVGNEPYRKQSVPGRQLSRSRVPRPVLPRSGVPCQDTAASP